MRKIGIQLPVNHKRSVFVRSVLWANDERPQEIRSILVSANQDGFYYRYLRKPKSQMCAWTNLEEWLKVLDTPS